MKTLILLYVVDFIYRNVESKIMNQKVIYALTLKLHIICKLGNKHIDIVRVVVECISKRLVDLNETIEYIIDK